MSKNLIHVASRFVNTPLMIHPPKLEVIVEGLRSRLGIDIQVPLEAVTDPREAQLRSSYRDAGVERSYEVMDAVAIIPVQGTLMKRMTGLEAWSGGCSYLQLQNQLVEAMNDASVQKVMLDIDSPGGETSGCFDLVDFIYGLRGQKPIYAVANDCALSAAYAIASAAEKIFVTRTGAVGSIGVYALHGEQSGYDAKLGVKYTYVYAGDRKVDGNPHEPLSERAYNDIKAEVDREYDMFTATVARNRGVDQKKVVSTQAGLYFADNGVPLLADSVGTFEDAMGELVALTPSKKYVSVGASAVDLLVNATSTTVLPAAESNIPMQTSDTTTSSNDDMECDDEPDDGLPGDDDENEDEEVMTDTNQNNNAAAAPAPTAPVPAPTAPVPAPAAVAADARSADDITAISNLCRIAGVDATSYLVRQDATTGRLMSVAAISAAITEERAQRSNSTVINNQVNPQNTGTAQATVEQLESQATAYARTNAASLANGLYIPGAVARPTPQRAFAAMLEDNPEAYAAYRKRHNARALVQTLRDAGVNV